MKAIFEDLDLVLTRREQPVVAAIIIFKRQDDLYITIKHSAGETGPGAALVYHCVSDELDVFFIAWIRIVKSRCKETPATPLCMAASLNRFIPNSLVSASDANHDALALTYCETYVLKQVHKGELKNRAPRVNVPIVECIEEFILACVSSANQGRTSFLPCRHIRALMQASISSCTRLRRSMNPIQKSLYNARSISDAERSKAVCEACELTQAR